MVTKHFFKILSFFTLMIALGLVGIYVISSFDRTVVNAVDTDGQGELAQ